MAQNEVEYKVRIARNKQGKNGEVIRIKFGKALMPDRSFDHCFVGIRNNRIYFKFFTGLHNVISKFDDSKTFKIIYLGEMPGITITSKRFMEYFAGYEGEYDKVGWITTVDLHVFYIEANDRHNYTNLYKNTSTVVTQKEEEAEDKLKKQLDLIHRNSFYGIQVPKEEEPISAAKDITTNSIYGTTQVKPADNMTTNQIIALQKWRDENTQEKRSYVGKKELTLGEGLNAMFDIMALRKAYTSLYLKVYYKALEKRDTVNVKYFSEKILGCMEFDDYKLFVHDVELALQSVIGFGERDYAELILDSIPDLYELTRDYN